MTSSDTKEVNTMSKTITPTEFGAQYGYSPKTVRDAMRAITNKEDQPGSGSRWAIECDSDFEAALIKRLADRNGNRKVVTATLKNG
jgi:hypothetical protein